MYKLSKQNWNTIILITFFILIIPYILYSPIALILIGIISITNLINFPSVYYMSISYYISAIVIIVMAIVSFNYIDKKKWPQVTGEIIDVKIGVEPMSILRQWTLKYIYKFNYNGKNYIKTTNSKIKFDNRYEGQKFINKIDWRGKRYFPVYVFKPFPRLSSPETKSNILDMFLLYLIIMTNVMLIFIGLVFRISVVYDVSASSQNDIFILIKNVFTIYLSKLDLISILLPTVIFLLLLVFIIKSITLLVKNKVYLFYARIDPSGLSEEPPYELPMELIQRKICSYCNTKNELEAIFCRNCGKYF